MSVACTGTGSDACPNDAAKAAPGTCGCGVADSPCCGSGDGDGDGVCDNVDQCLSGDDGADADSDGTPDACDRCPGTVGVAIHAGGCSSSQFCEFIPEACERPRVVVLTDVGNRPLNANGKDGDDQQSLVRFLAHSNEFEVEGFIATTSWTLNSQGQQTFDVAFPDTIHSVIDAYADAYPNLQQHVVDSAPFPTPASLHDVVKTGRTSTQADYMGGSYFAADIGAGRSSEGSDFIKQLLTDDSNTRHIWFLAFGKTIDLGQALFELKNELSAAAMSQVAARVRVYDVRGQDDVGAYIARQFPEVFYIRSLDGFQGSYLTGDGSLFDESWINTHLRSHTALGDWYPSTVFSHVVAEGDTPAFLFLLSQRFGLSLTTAPWMSSWGGMFTRTLQRNIGRGATPYDMYGDSPFQFSNPRSHVSRWREAWQREFQARMDWAKTSRYADANHPPVAVLNGDANTAPLDFGANAGQSVTLSAAGSYDNDPGQTVSYEWVWEWSSGVPASDTPALGMAVSGSTVRVTIPQSASFGDEYHIVLAVTDDGSPALTRYRRAVVLVLPDALPSEG